MAAHNDIRFQLDLLRALVDHVNVLAVQGLEQDGLARIRDIRNLPDRLNRSDARLRAVEEALGPFARVYSDNWRLGASGLATIEAEREQVHARIDRLERALDPMVPDDVEVAPI